jgi:hypothetical protein
MKKKKKINFKETDYTGPFGVGKSAEEIKNLDVFQTLQGNAAFQKIINDLDEKERDHVLKDSELFSGKWQKVLMNLAKTLETPEGKKAFKEAVMKKSGN